MDSGKLRGWRLTNGRHSLTCSCVTPGALAATRTCDSAVIDAATACEVGLSDCILAGLANVVSSDEAKAMLKRRNGLMELYDFYVASVAQPATVSWGRLNGRLPGPRNLVAHEGHRPSAAETKAAIEVATALVSEVAPVDVP